MLPLEQIKDQCYKLSRIASVSPIFVCDWSGKHAPFSRQMRCHSNNNRDLVSAILPRFRHFAPTKVYIKFMRYLALFL